MRHLNFSGEEILETIQMVRTEQLDIRTITVGISLLDCVSDSCDGVCRNVYEKVERITRDLRRVSAEIAEEFGLPIINNRIAVTPISLIAGRSSPGDLVRIAETLDRAAHAVDVDFIGGFSTNVEKGMTQVDANLFAAIPEALAATKRVCASVNVGSTRAGLNMDAIADIGRIVGAPPSSRARKARSAAPSSWCSAMRSRTIRSWPAPFTAPARRNGRSMSGSAAPASCSERSRRPATSISAHWLRSFAARRSRSPGPGELVGRTAAARLGLPFGIVDLSLAPTPAEGDSVARILEEIGLERVGTHGSTAALALLNDAVKKGGAMASSYVGGLSGAFIPLSEDAGMIEAAERGAVTIDKLEAMTAVCSVGLDMIAIPGDTPAETIAAIIADEAAIGMINKKTTAVRLIPAVGKRVGDWVDFGGLLGRAPVIPVNTIPAAG